MLKSILQPSGKIHQNYNKFIFWSTLSNIIVSIQSTISTHDMLSVIKTGDTNFEISLNYMSKEIFGQLGSLFILNKIGKNVDLHMNKFKNISLGVQHTSFFIESLTPFVPSYFIPISSIANIGKNICWPCFGAINTKSIQKLSQDNNVGEIYTKLSIFNTFGSSVGMISGLFIIHMIPETSFRLLLFPILTSLRIYTLNKSLKTLDM